MYVCMSSASVDRCMASEPMSCRRDSRLVVVEVDLALLDVDHLTAIFQRSLARSLALGGGVGSLFPSWPAPCRRQHLWRFQFVNASVLVRRPSTVLSLSERRTLKAEACCRPQSKAIPVPTNYCCCCPFSAFFSAFCFSFHFASPSADDDQVGVPGGA